MNQNTVLNFQDFISFKGGIKPVTKEKDLKWFKGELKTKQGKDVRPEFIQAESLEEARILLIRKTSANLKLVNVSEDTQNQNHTFRVIYCTDCSEGNLVRVKEIIKELSATSERELWEIAEQDESHDIWIKKIERVS